MPDYDLMSEDDFFSELKDEKKKQESEKKPEPQAASEPPVEDDLFSRPPEEEASASMVEEEPFAEEEENQTGDFSQDIHDSLEIDEQETQPVPDVDEEEEMDLEEEAAPEEAPIEYEDEKQEKINYKPLVYIFLAVVLIIIGYFVVSTFILGGGGKEEAQQQKAAEKAPVAAQKEQGPSPEEIKKKAFENQLAATTSRQMNFLGDFSSIAGKHSRISSILLYGSDLLIQVFAKDRSALAKVSLNLKNNFKNQKIEIISSDERPGGNGVLGLFKVTLSAAGARGGAEVSSPLETAQAAQQWLEFLAQNSNLKLKNVQYRSAGEQDNFVVYELSAAANGRLDNCLKLLSAISSSAKNIKIHKLNLTAVDQKNFNPKKYQLKLIIKIFV